MHRSGSGTIRSRWVLLIRLRSHHHRHIEGRQSRIVGANAVTLGLTGLRWQ